MGLSDAQAAELWRARTLGTVALFGLQVVTVPVFLMVQSWRTCKLDCALIRAVVAEGANSMEELLGHSRVELRRASRKEIRDRLLALADAGLLGQFLRHMAR